MLVTDLQKPTVQNRPQVRFELAEHQHKAVIFICFEYHQQTNEKVKKLPGVK